MAPESAVPKSGFAGASVDCWLRNLIPWPRGHYAILIEPIAANVVTGYITRRAAGEPRRVHVVTVAEDVGWFAVAADIKVPDGAPEVALEYEDRGGERWITSLSIVTDLDS